MSCGLKKIWEEGQGPVVPPLPPTPPPNPQKVENKAEMEASTFVFTDPVWGRGRGSGRGGRGSTPLAPSPDLPTSLAYGLDFGSRAVKLVYPRGPGSVGRRRWDSITFYRNYLVRDSGQLTIAWERLGLPTPAGLVATGYGKNLLKAHFPTITEIRAHFQGARFITALDHFILLEIGGQDTKVLYVREGRVFDFLTNDRCAAGTGRYLENMARFLKMPLSEFSGYWQDPADVSQTCAIFGETELVGHLLEGVDPSRIAAGVNASVARRALAMVRRYRCPTLVFVGGVAKNQALVRLLENMSDFQVVVPPHPQFNGALGCALEAGRQLDLQQS